MSNSTQPTPPPSSSQFDRLADYSQPINYFWSGVTLLGVGFAIYSLAREGLDAGLRPVLIWVVSVSMISLIFALIGFTTPASGKFSRSDKVRLLLLGAGVLIGLVTTLLGFALPFFDYQEELSGGLQSWRSHPGAIIYPSLALLGGLGLMFASVQLGRGMERQNQQIRLLIYGVNTLLMSLLLIAVLALPNVLAYAEPFARFFGRPYDWTKTNTNVISDAMRNLLSGLQEPVKVYVILPRNNVIMNDTQNLLDNCRSLSTKFSWEHVDPNSSVNQSRLLGFMEKYTLADPRGLLIIRGVESEKSKSDYAFVKFRDLYREDTAPQRRGGLSYIFTGENALYQALRNLIEGKMVLYFTEGHGEFAFAPTDPRMPGAARGRVGGLSVLKERLSERKSVEVKSLKVGPSLKKIPDDASVVIIARPREMFNADEVKLFRDYLKRLPRMKKAKDANGAERDEEEVTAGKLMVLAGPVTEKQGDKVTMARTGLEGLLAEYNVKLGDNRIQAYLMQDPLSIVAVMADESPNPVAKAFRPEGDKLTGFLFRNVRTVEPLADQPGGAVAVDRLLLALKRQGLWLETDFSRDPQEAAAALRADRALRTKTEVKEEPCLAVAVSDSSAGGAPRDAAHAGLTKDMPRMVVFGTSAWISDESLNGRGSAVSLDLFNSCISWLREKQSIGVAASGIEDKTRTEYVPNIPPTDVRRVLFLPLALMLLGVIGLGTGVWVVRRS